MLSRTAEYAIEALVCLSQNRGCPVTAERLAAVSSTSTAYLRKVLNQLGKAKLVCGRRGLGGGFTLAVPADRLTVQAVIDAVNSDGQSRDGRRQSTAATPAHSQLDAVLLQMMQMFSTMTIADLVHRCEGRSANCGTSRANGCPGIL